MSCNEYQCVERQGDTEIISLHKFKQQPMFRIFKEKEIAKMPEINTNPHNNKFYNIHRKEDTETIEVYTNSSKKLCLEYFKE